MRSGSLLRGSVRGTASDRHCHKNAYGNYQEQYFKQSVSHFAPPCVADPLHAFILAQTRRDVTICFVSRGKTDSLSPPGRAFRTSSGPPERTLSALANGEEKQYNSRIP